MRFDDRYTSAVRSSNLKSKPDTVQSDSDVLGAAGLAGKHAPLAMALMRLFAGDNHASREIVAILGAMADGKAYRLGIEITRVEAEDIGRRVLAWVRYGMCTACGGHGFRLAGDGKLGEGRQTLSGHRCQACRGTGRRPFDLEFSLLQLDLARWLLAETEREAAKAGPLAMAALR